jgi:hypothetical protein
VLVVVETFAEDHHPTRIDFIFADRRCRAKFSASDDIPVNASPSSAATHFCTMMKEMLPTLSGLLGKFAVSLGTDEGWSQTARGEITPFICLISVQQR